MSKKDKVDKKRQTDKTLGSIQYYNNNITNKQILTTIVKK